MAHTGRIGISTIAGVALSAVILALLCTAAGASGVGQWTATDGPSSDRGNVHLLVVDTAIPGTAYAVVEASGLHTLYRTTDGANSWTYVHSFKQTVGSLLAIDDVLYMGARDVPEGQPAIWRSSDRGATWTPVYTATATTDVHALTPAPGSQDHVYAALGTSDGGAMLRTTDGTTWTTVLENDGTLEAVALGPSGSGLIYAAGNDASNLAEVYRSVNAGADWSLVLTSETEKFEQFLVVHPDDPEIVFAKTRRDFCCPPPSPHLWRSRDGGDSWHSIQIPPYPAQPDNPVGLYNAVFVRPDSIYGLDSLSYQTHNASADTPDWTWAEPVLRETFVFSGAADDRGTTPATDPAADPLIYLGFWIEGVCTSRDSLETVQVANDGFHNLLEPLSITVDPHDGRTLYVVTRQDGYRSTDGGESWTPMDLETFYDVPMYPLSFAVSPDDPEVVLMGVEDASGGGMSDTTFRSIHRSTDGGATWSAVYTNTTSMFSEVAFGVAFDPNDSSRAYALSGPETPAEPVGTVILTSTDGGETWTQRGTYPGMYPGMSVLRVDPDGIVYVGGRTWAPPDAPVSTLIRSADQGTTWETVYEGGDTLIRDLTFDPVNPDNVYMVEEHALLVSRDRGQTWQEILASEAALYSVLHDPHSSGRLYLGIEGPVVLMSYDGGTSWVELKNWKDAYSAPQVMSLAAAGDRVERVVYAGLDGVWKYVLSGTEGQVSPSQGGSITATTPEGGSTTVEVPAGAVGEETTLLYMPAVAPVDWLEPTGLRFAGQAFTLDAYVDGVHQAGFAFTAPVTVTLHYSDADLAGVDEGSLTLQLWHEGEWMDAAETCSPVSTYDRNPEENRLSVGICHLSYYALAGSQQYRAHLPLVVR